MSNNVPKVVSLGPYHHGKPDLESVEGFKQLYTNRLLKGNEDSMYSLYNSLDKMVQKLRGYYEDDAGRLSDDEFTRMMLLDGCFILYIIKQIFWNFETDTLELKSYQIMLIQQDMFMLENQIPYQVLTEIMKFLQDESWVNRIRRFVDDYLLREVHYRMTSRLTKVTEHQDDITHLLELLQTSLTKEKFIGRLPFNRYTIRNAKELIEVGIHFKPIQTRSLASIKFSKCGFFATLELPPIIVDDSTKSMLNLVAYETCSSDTSASWVTSYICLLDSLIDHAEDFKVLRKAGIINNGLGSDEEVAQLINTIGRDLVPNNFAFAETSFEIQKHYNTKRNTRISQLKREYIRSPWAFVALLVGLVSLFLSSVQTYFSV